MRYIFSAIGLLVAGGLVAPNAVRAQQDFEFRGIWIGEFEDKSEPERDIATRGNTGAAFGLSDGGGRDRAILGDGRFECEGQWTLTFRGPNDELRGRGDAQQTCKAVRNGTWRIPTETMDLYAFEYANKGEGKEKELRFEFEQRARPGPNTSSGAGRGISGSLIDDSNELIRCAAVGRYKPSDDVFEGTYTCRQDIRRAQAGRSRRTMAITTRGEFKLKRGQA
jgi:hypothetical protein